MDASALIDTGAILALLDKSDRWHRICVDAFQQLRLPLLTSEAVLTELFHLVGESRLEMEAAWRIVVFRNGPKLFNSVPERHIRSSVALEENIKRSCELLAECVIVEQA